MTEMQEPRRRSLELLTEASLERLEDVRALATQAVRERLEEANSKIATMEAAAVRRLVELVAALAKGKPSGSFETELPDDGRLRTFFGEDDTNPWDIIKSADDSPGEPEGSGNDDTEYW